MQLFFKTSNVLRLSFCHDYSGPLFTAYSAAFACQLFLFLTLNGTFYKKKQGLRY